MSERERVERAIATCEAKRDAAKDPESRWYYEMCLVGWRAHLKRLGEAV